MAVAPDGSPVAGSPMAAPMDPTQAQNIYVDEMHAEHIAHGKPEVTQQMRLTVQYEYDSPLQEGRQVAMRLQALAQRSDRPGRVHLHELAFPHVVSLPVQLNSIDEDSAALLTALVKSIQPRTCLETGTHKGRSTRAIAEGLVHVRGQGGPTGHLWTLDRSDWQIKTSGALRSAECDFVTCCFGSSPEALNAAPLADLTDIDFAFLDSVHSGEGVLAELRWLEKRIADECLVVVDNARDAGWPGIQKMLSTYTDHPHINISTLSGLELIWMRR